MKKHEKEKVIEKKENKAEKKKPEAVAVEDSPIREKMLLFRKNSKILWDYLVRKVKDYRYVIGVDVVVFALLFFLIPIVILKVKPVIWMIAFILFAMLPTIAVYWFHKFREKQILFSFFFIYFLIFLVLDRCTAIDLYGITSLGELDYTKPWLDAIFVTCIIVFFQYVGILLVNFLQGSKKKKKKKLKKVIKSKEVEA